MDTNGQLWVIPVVPSTSFILLSFLLFMCMWCYVYVHMCVCKCMWGGLGLTSGIIPKPSSCYLRQGISVKLRVHRFYLLTSSQLAQFQESCLQVVVTATEHLRDANQKSFHLALTIEPSPKPYIFLSFFFFSFLFLEFGSCGSEALQV